MSFKTLSQSIVKLTGDVWGDSVTYTPNGSAAVSINGVFNNAYIDVEGVVLLKPLLRINLGDLADAPGKGDRVTINGTDYRVDESRLDEFGGSTLILKKV